MTEVTIAQIKPRYNKTQDKCQHQHFTFFGLFSLIGNYFCDECGFKVSPEEIRKGEYESN